MYKHTYNTNTTYSHESMELGSQNPIQPRFVVPVQLEAIANMEPQEPENRSPYNN